MKLSEAIRLGAMMKPQGFGPASDRYGDGTSCALQAAADAVSSSFIYSINDLFPILNSLPQCPACKHATFGGVNVGSTIWHLNDTHRWSRELIASWVETIEQQHEASGTRHERHETATNVPAVDPSVELTTVSA